VRKKKLAGAVAVFMVIKHCPFCGLQVDTYTRFCPRCGREIPKPSAGMTLGLISLLTVIIVISFIVWISIN